MKIDLCDFSKSGDFLNGMYEKNCSENIVYFKRIRRLGK